MQCFFLIRQSFSTPCFFKHICISRRDWSQPVFRQEFLHIMHRAGCFIDQAERWCRKILLRMIRSRELLRAHWWQARWRRSIVPLCEVDIVTDLRVGFALRMRFGSTLLWKVLLSRHGVRRRRDDIHWLLEQMHQTNWVSWGFRRPKIGIKSRSIHRPSSRMIWYPICAYSTAAVF